MSTNPDQLGPIIWPPSTKILFRIALMAPQVNQVQFGALAATHESTIVIVNDNCSRDR